MEQMDNTEEEEAPCTPQAQAGPMGSVETKREQKQSRRDTKKAYSQPALNGSPSFSVHEEEGDVVFSPVRRLEFSSGNDDTKQSDLASLDSNLGNFENLVGDTTSQNVTEKDHQKPEEEEDDDDDISALVISNIQYVDGLDGLPPSNQTTDTLCDHQSLPGQCLDCLDDNFAFLLQTRSPEKPSPANATSVPNPGELEEGIDRQSYYLLKQTHEQNLPLVATQEHRYPADGRNKQSGKQVLANSGQSGPGQLLPGYPTSLRPGLSYPPLVRTVPYGAEREEKNRSKSQVLVSSVSSLSQPKSPTRSPGGANESIPNDQSQFSSKTLLIAVPDRTKFMQGNSKGDIESCPRPEDMPGGAMQEIELLRGQLQSAIQVPLKCQIDTDLFDYSQNDDNGLDSQPEQLVSAIPDVPSISGVEATETVSWLMDYATNGLNAEESNPQQILEPSSSSSATSATTVTTMLPVSSAQSLQNLSYRQQPLTNQTQYTAYLDNIKLKEELEKERFRRRHCEKYIEQLNAKMLDVQQQLAVAVSTNRKKEILVEHLDKQLGKIMSTWKAKDAEKVQLINELQKEKSFQEQIIEDQRKLTTKMRDDFSEVMEELNKEKDKTTRVIKKLEEMELKEKSLENQLLNEKEQNQGMVEEWEYQSERLRTSEEIVSELNNQIEQEHAKSIEREQELLKKIEEISASHKSVQQKEKEQTEELLLKVSKSESQIQSLEKENSEMKLKLENLSREKESLKVEIGLIEAKHENNQKQLETRLESQMEKEITAIIEDVHKKRESFENRLQEEHKQQIISLNEHHSLELNNLLQKYQTELKHKEQKFSLHLQSLDQTLKTMRDENTSLKILNQRLESQRCEALNKFQNIMQPHWIEAISILGGSTNLDSQAYSEVTVRSPESVTSEESPPLAARLFASKEVEHCVNPSQVVHPHPQTSSPKKDGMNVSSFTVNSEQINSLVVGQRRSNAVTDPNVVPNYLKSLTEENLEERNHTLQNSERLHNNMKESSKSQSFENQDLTVLEPDTNILWYEKDSLQPSFIQTGPYMTAVPMRPPMQTHSLSSVNQSVVNSRNNELGFKLIASDRETQGPESCSESDITPPIKQSGEPKKDGEQNQVLTTEAKKLKDDYQILSERLMQQNSRQEELQHFIQMLLNRIPNFKILQTPNLNSNNQEFEEKRSEFYPLEVTNGNSTRMSDVINLSQPHEKPERLVQQTFPLEISHQQQPPAPPPPQQVTTASYPQGPPANPFQSVLTPSCLQDIQQLLEFYKAQENGQADQPNYVPPTMNEKAEEGKMSGLKKQELSTKTGRGSIFKQPNKPNKGHELRSREKANSRKNRSVRAYEKMKSAKTSGSGSNSSNTSNGNPVWK